MADLHINDKLAALEWAINKARQEATDPLVRYSVLPALQHMRDQAQQEARK